ncbi:phosphatidate cytidylyltransferase [Psychrosphaera sp. B3R10]|uniref:Phosphatidate cytidylyltransferase n=1 Tax=Psychrosphaera algicola TaxID=3023714 RepID=A0ABT5FA63_9GAMM|nr:MULTISPECIES: phosphatidate cytidylyltransferase [unclassified Psychrosphaera]MBU2883892.1 phosphatidate cytidylyltransferase [Psychrosphaera sp. I2R16]MBU2988755.1 phosphatidate cytidylyltransferase [Psychrosphaera sp. B3R10]MDC2888423.1 phosphatidate cytidylyltransferase [Psychrosphaera sp. G1-22]MDO6718557.1 phosphatidate cytidylyltransferase [Psychrosphaera sp. 1_MG-2023]
MLKQRIITALILGALLLLALFNLPSDWFTWLSLGVFGYAAYEWSKLAEIKSAVNQLLYAGGSVALGLALYLGYLEQDLWTITGQLTEQNYLLMLCACCWWFVSSVLVLIYPRGNRVWQHQPIVKAVFGYLTVIPAWLALLTIRQWHYELDVDKGAWLALFVFGIVWAADIGAYFAGRRFGSHKLMPRVSPGKTIEGFLGGMAAVVLLTVYVLWNSETSMDSWFVLILSCVAIGVISAFGDLSESMLKRDAGMKDSGNILPGHGGLLDRIDSLTAAMPVFLVFFSHFYLN